MTRADQKIDGEQRDAVAYRLRDAQTEQSFMLGRGVYRIGSARGNDVVLSAPSVSRRHALLVVEPERVTLDDLASKNGTRVNGSRVGRWVLKAGDEIGFGDTRLVLERTPAEAARLAIRLPETEEPSSDGNTPETSVGPAWASRTGQRCWSPLIERFLGRLSASQDLTSQDPTSQDIDLGGGLGLVLDELACDGVALLEVPSHGQVSVTASAGHLGDIQATARAIVELRAGMGPGQIRVADDASAAWPLAAALIAGLDGTAMAMVVRGDFPDRSSSALLLQSLVRIANLVRLKPLLSPHDEIEPEPDQLVFPPASVAGVSPAIQGLHRQMQLVCGTDVPVLILGETGVGKEHVARILHASSKRQGRFVALNCAAIPADLLEAELFGIAKGVATGVTARRGRFELAQGGTLLLDEIGEIPLDLQAKLLRALQEKEIQPVGGEPLPIDVQILSATNMDLLAKARQSLFRADLYYRLAGVSLEVPPLRRRREDIPLFLEHFLRRFSKQFKKRVRGVMVGALDDLLTYSWPGNVRELEHEVRRLVMLCPYRQPIHEELLSPHIRNAPAPTEPKINGNGTQNSNGAQGGNGVPDIIGVSDGETQTGLTLEEVEKRTVQEALEKCRGNQVRAASLLGISRYALRRRIERLDLV